MGNSAWVQAIPLRRGTAMPHAQDREFNFYFVNSGWLRGTSKISVSGSISVSGRPTLPRKKKKKNYLQNPINFGHYQKVCARWIG